jgi:riboflavin synthase
VAVYDLVNSAGKTSVMFTGLVEGVGIVKGVRRIRGDMRMRVEPQFSMPDSRLGDSISVNGVCLTVTDISENTLSMDISEETLSRSTLSQVRQGDEVNLERALRVGDRLGGHLVSGHVDGTGKISRKVAKKNSWLLRIDIGEAISRYIVEKGSVAVDGISLTVNYCTTGFFEVNIIPQTGVETTILKRSPGDSVNIETDLIGKYVEKFFLNDRSTKESKGGSGIDLEMIMEQGFGD